MELRRWKTCVQHLEDVNVRLVKESEEVTLRSESLAHPDLALNPRHNPIITCKDVAFSRYGSCTGVSLQCVFFSFLNQKKKETCLQFLFIYL